MGDGDRYPLVQKGQTPPCSGYAVCSAQTVSAQYAVGVRAKRSNPPRSGYAVRSAHAVSAQYAVGVSAKRSTGTVELANMGGGDRYPSVQKGQSPRSECAVRSRC